MQLRPILCWCLGLYLYSGAPCLPPSSPVFPGFVQRRCKFLDLDDAEPDSWVWMRPLAAGQCYLACGPPGHVPFFPGSLQSRMSLCLPYSAALLGRFPSCSELSTRVPHHPNNHPWERKSLCSALLYSFPITSQVSQSWMSKQILSG